MDEILTVLQSPATWVLLIAGYVVTLVLGSLKDAASRWLARSSSSYRQWRATTLARKEREIEFLSREPTILTLYNIANTILLILSLCFIVFSILFLVGTQSVLASPELTLSFMKLASLNRIMWTLVVLINMFVFTLLAAFTSFLFAARWAVGTRAYRRLYKRRQAEFERNAAPPETMS